MSSVNVVEYAKNLLRSLPGAGRDVRSLVVLLQRCKARTLRDTEVFCQEGDPGDTMFFLVSGAIRVERRAADGPRTLFRMRPPAVIGHMSLVDNSPRSATLVSEDAAQVLVLDRATWIQLAGEASPEGAALRHVVMCSLAVQLCRTTNLLNNLLPDADSAAHKGVEKNTLRDLAGAVGAWDLDTSEVDKVDFVKSDVVVAKRLRE